MQDQPIGIIDSGVGGLSVWMEVVDLLPSESVIYLADSANIPYGTKSTEEIEMLTTRLVEFLVSQKVKLLIIACNTITVTCLDVLRRNNPQLPIIGVVPVVKTAVAVSKKKRIGILSTTVTANSEYQKKLIKEFALGFDVTNRGTDRLVSFVEKGETDGEGVVNILKEVLQPFQDAGIDALALGCTHFPFLEEQMRSILGDTIMILDSGAAVARHVKRILDQNDILSVETKPAYTFYTTGDAIELEAIAKKLVGTRYRDKIGKVKKVSSI